MLIARTIRIWETINRLLIVYRLHSSEDRCSLKLERLVLPGAGKQRITLI